MASRPSKKKAKVRPSEPTPCAVLWGLDPSSEPGSSVRALLGEMGIVVRDVAFEHLGDSAASCARVPGFRPAPLPYAGLSPEGELLLLCNLSSSQMDEFLAKSRERGCVVGAKAQLTRVNRLWPLVRLVTAVNEEHRQMGGR